MTTQKMLYNQKDISEERSKRLKNQGNLCLLSGVALDAKDSVLDHCHNTQRVRGTIHRQMNAGLGKIENAYRRYIGPTVPGYHIEDWLEDVVHYLRETASDDSTLHPAWIRKSKTLFRGITADQQRIVLAKFFVSTFKDNAEGRLTVFDKLLRSKAVNFSEVKFEIEGAKLVRSA